MFMPPLAGEQAAGVSTAESECSGSCSSKQGGSSPIETEAPMINPATVQMEPEANPSTATASPASTPPASRRASLHRIFSNPLPSRRTPSTDDSRRRNTTGSQTIANLNLSSSSIISLGSAPTILIRADASSIESKPIRSIMTSRTLHESLHRGSSSNRRKQRSSITFGQVNIREYERILGDNPSVTSGPPLSIGWRYSPTTINLSVETFESGKGPSRSSSEYLVPKAVREKILREHADATRRDIAATVRTINRHKQQRRNTVVNIPMAGTQEKMEKVKRSVEKVMGRRSWSYSKEEARLWEDAHAVALEKARRLEESVRKGEKLSMGDVYTVGTPWNNLVPSVVNSMVVGNEMEEEGNNGEETENALQEEEDGLKQSRPVVSDLYKPTSGRIARRLSDNFHSLDRSERLSPTKNRLKRFDEQFRHSDSDLSMHRTKAGIVASEYDDDVEDIFAKLVLDESG